MFSFTRFSIRFIQLLALVASLSASSWAGESDRLDHLLAVDRFEAYLTRLSGVVAGRGKPAVAKVLLDVTPEEIDQMHLDPVKLADPSQFDDLALQVAKIKSPGIAATKEDVTWSYNFFKRKLGEVYRVQNPKIEYTDVKTETGAVSRTTLATAPSIDPALDSQTITGLDVESYVSDRTTRGAFWEASESGRKIEFHIGSRRSFLENMASRKIKVLGEVKAYARNYNPIFLIQEPGSTDFHYAIAEVSGMDRLQHLATQSSVIRWKAPNGQRMPPPPTEVYGSPVINAQVEEEKLLQMLKTLPHADKVVIGQKGAFERSFRVLGKRQALLDFIAKNPDVLPPLLNDKEKKFITKAAAEPQANFLSSSMKNSSEWESLYEKVGKSLTTHQLPPLQGSAVFTVDRGSYEFSDYMLKGANGSTQRWRIFSNSWGDEILPEGYALKRAGYAGSNAPVYIGTAGAMPNSGLRVGDVVVPAQAVDGNGVTRKLFVGDVPPTMKSGHTVAHVATPFEETNAWIQGTQTTSHLVEVETGYLAKVFNDPSDKVRVFLMVSDVVGSETETLADPSSSIRKKGQIDIMNTVMSDAGVTGAASGAEAIPYTQNEKWVNELLPNRDEISKFQVLQKAHAQGIVDKAGLEALIASEKPFTSVKADDAIIRSSRKLKQVLALAEDKGIIPKISLSKDFLDGRWNPANPIEMHFEVHNPGEVTQVSEILNAVKAEDPRLEKLLRVHVATTPPAAEIFVSAPQNLSELQEVYRGSALRFGGLAATENRSGALKFIKIHSAPTQNFAHGTVNYFPPNETTGNLLKQMKDVDNPEVFLRGKINTMNVAVQNTDPYEIRLSIVDNVPGGGKAQILPTLGENKIFIDLKITPEGLKNPAVMMEELLHLQQITSQGVPWASGQRFTTYMNPYQWVETVNNAKSGSVQAQEKLARMELEAANMTEQAAKFYQTELFGSTPNQVIEDYAKSRAEHAKVLYKDVEKAAKVDAKARELAWQNQKKVFEGIEKETLKLNDLVAKGDRKAVRKMISDYLPWPLMEPSEKRGWTQWLEALEKPDPARTKLMFRGLQDDLVMKTATGEPYFMSSVMTHNQGSYTRRLRSLSTLREKFGSHAINTSFVSPYNLKPDSPTTLSSMMHNHSFEPRGSPFLSVSNYDVANGFAGQRMGAFMIDERRIVPNAFASPGYFSESERLIPLIIFPDEVAVYHDYSLNPLAQGQDRKVEFLKEVETKIGRAPTAFEINRSEDPRKFLQDSYAGVKDLILKEEVPANPGGCVTPALQAMFPL